MTSWLQRYHAEPGKGPVMLEPWRAPDGRSSYQLLVDEVTPLAASSRVLDLACGDGYLLGLLSAQGFGDLVGVDQSAAELSRARERLGAGAELHCRRAQALPLPDRSVDTTVCHWGLMIIEPLEPALTEVARVLKPGGSLVAVVNRYLVDPVNEVYRKWLHRTRTEAGIERPRGGDRRVLTIDGMKELLVSQSFDGESLSAVDLELHAHTTAEALWASLRLTYDIFLLPEKVAAEVKRRVLRGWEPHLDEEGLLSCKMGIRLLKCRTVSVVK